MGKKLAKQPNMTEKSMISIQSHINRMQAVSSLERQSEIEHANTMNDLREKLKQSIRKDDKKAKEQLLSSTPAVPE